MPSVRACVHISFLSTFLHFGSQLRWKRLLWICMTSLSFRAVAAPLRLCLAAVNPPNPSQPLPLSLPATRSAHWEPNIMIQKYLMGETPEEYSMAGWKFAWHCTKVWGQMKDSCLWAVCIYITSVIQVDSLSEIVTATVLPCRPL